MELKLPGDPINSRHWDDDYSGPDIAITMTKGTSPYIFYQSTELYENATVPNSFTFQPEKPI